MQRKKNSEEKIVYALKQAGSGVTIAEITRKMGVSTATFYAWKKRFSGFEVSELRKLKQLEEEVRRLRQLVADLSLDKHMLQEVVAKNL